MNHKEDSVKEVRAIADGPFSWQSKSALRLIRQGFDQTTFLDQALAVYLTHTELASDAQSPTYCATRRKIAERSGASIRRVTEINNKLKALQILDWKQQSIEGTMELGENLYTLLRPGTACPTQGTACTRSGTEAIRENCTVDKESIEQSPEESSKNINFEALGIANRIICDKDGWYYDNCKVSINELKTNSLATKIRPYVVGLSSDEIVKEWRKAVGEAHAAHTDEMVEKNPEAYCIGCFEKRLRGRISAKIPMPD